MKKTFLKLSVLTIAVGFSLATSASEFDHYLDWQNKPVTVQTPQADTEVRHQMDFTVPIHGPWLLNPSYTTMSVNWITRVPCGAAIEYRVKGTEEWTRIWDVICGQINLSKDIHTFHLKNLKPATEYEYRLLSAQNSYFSPYHEVHIGREIRTFKTLDPKRDNYKVFITSDFHGGSRLILDPMIDRSKAIDSDMFFFLGDNVEDSMQNARFYVTFGFLDDVVRRWGSSKPTVFVRGNHDSWGLESYRYHDYFAQPDGKTYGYVLQGPVLFVYFDYFEGINPRTLIGQQIVEYLKEQTAWYRELKKTDVWKKAKFRIAMAHVGTHACEGSRNPQEAVVDWAREINDPTPDGKIHIFLCGHEHKYRRIDAYGKETKVSTAQTRYIRPFKSEYNYSLVVCNLAETMTLEVTPEKLTFKSHEWRDDSGKLHDAFEIYPDGKTKDLIDVKKFPIQPFSEPPKKKK